MNLDVDGITKRLESFILKHKTEFNELPRRQSAILELTALILTAEHYRVEGYNVIPKNLKDTNFRVKTTSKGYPKNFSWFECNRDNTQFEIHANISVYGAHKDKGTYVVDVGIVKPNQAEFISGKSKKAKKGSSKVKEAIANSDLITFMEVKKLVIYPMLLAQFVGIVHEIKPKFLGKKIPKDFDNNKHFYPLLGATGYLSGNSQRIIDGYKKRKMKLLIIPNLENRFFYLDELPPRSPLIPKQIADLNNDIPF